MNVDQSILARQYQESVAKAKTRAAEFAAPVYVCAALAVRSGVPCVVGFNLSDFHDGSAVCRVNVSRSGAATISEI
jgi:hypothetical protein